MQGRKPTKGYVLSSNSPMLRLVERRTPQDSAAFLLPYLHGEMRFLDAGCGPGNLTAGFKTLYPTADVIGVDVNPANIHHAIVAYGDVAKFVQADVSKLPFKDNSFDVIHCNQVMQYIDDVPKVLREFSRVLKPGGLLAGRVSSFRHFITGPVLNPLFNETFSRFVEAGGGNQDVGTILPGLLIDAGFNGVEVGASFSRYIGQKRQIFAADMLAIMREGGMGKQFIHFDLANENQVRQMEKAFEDVRDCKSGYLLTPNIEVLGWK